MKALWHQPFCHCPAKGLNLVFSIAALFMWSACGQQDNKELVALVGKEPITAEQLRRFALDVLPGLRPAKQGQEARRDYLQTLIDRQLMLQEARALGLEREPAMSARYEIKRRQYLASLFRKREILPNMQVSDADIERFFKEQGLERERLFSAILVESEEKAKQIHEQLRAGGKFEELASVHSLNARAAKRGGELGFVNRPKAMRMGIPGEVFDTLETTAVSPPLPLGQRFHLVRFIEDRNADVKEQRTAIETRLAKAKQRDLEDQKVEVLAYEFGWQMAPAGLSVLQRQAKSLEAAGFQLAEAERRLPLFTYEEGEVSIGEYLEVLKARHIKNEAALRDSSLIASFVFRFVLPDLMFAEAAARLGIQEEPGVVEWLKRTNEELLLKVLHQRRVSDQVAVENEEAERYIQAHAGKFMTPEFICFDELIVPDREEANQLKVTLSAQEDLAQIAQERDYPLRPRREDGLVCMHSLFKTPYPNLWQALQEADLNVLEGPVQTRDGYALFKVIRKEPPQPEPLDSALPRARGILLQRAEQVRFDEWVISLRDKYRHEVEVFSAELEAALPEALLASLIRETPED